MVFDGLKPGRVEERDFSIAADVACSPRIVQIG